eukprot:13134154-Heterocapsa_arctica.AAC.1
MSAAALLACKPPRDAAEQFICQPCVGTVPSQDTEAIQLPATEGNADPSIPRGGGRRNRSCQGEREPPSTDLPFPELTPTPYPPGRPPDAGAVAGSYPAPSSSSKPPRQGQSEERSSGQETDGHQACPSSEPVPRSNPAKLGHAVLLANQSK